MLQDLDKTLSKVIYTAGKINKNEVEIAFDQPTSDWSSRLGRPTLNCWCFDLRENTRLRNLQREVGQDARMAQISMPSRRFDVSYLITAWARKTEDEHQLIWRVLAALKKTTTLDPNECEGLLRYQTREIPLLVATVSPDHPVNLVDLWSVLGNEMRLGFTVVLTVELDLEIAFQTPLVLEKTIRIGQSEDPQTHTITAPDDDIIQKAQLPTDGNTGKEKKG